MSNCCAYWQFRRTIFALALLASVLFVYIPYTLAAISPPSVEWNKTYEGIRATSVIQTLDGNYIVAGIAGSSGITLLKTDSSGNPQWQKAYGSVVSLAKTSDSGCVLFCENGAVVKTDAEGNTTFSFNLGLNGVIDGTVGSDGSYLVVGNSFESGEAYAWLRKTDSQGNILWDKKFTGGFHVSSVAETDDRGCALAGNWKTDFWLARLDSNGNQQWSQTYAYGGITDSHFVYSMTATRDGGFILAGAGDWQSSGSMVPWLIKINSLGHEQWNLPYGQYPQDSFSDVIQTTDEGYLVAQAEAATLIRTDSSGSELWKVALGVPGGWVSTYPSSGLIRTADDGYVIAGSSSAGSFLIKISPEENLQPPVVTVSSPKSKTYETGDIPLAFTVTEQTSWFGYSLDGAPTVTVTGNTTLTGLPIGAHNITVHARDLTGLVGNSITIQFTIAARFPTEFILASASIAVAAVITLLLYAKRKSLSEYRKRGLRTLFKKQSLAKIVNNRMALTLIIISLCFALVFVQVFFPYVYYSSSSVKLNASFEVGVSYVYERDSPGQIYNEVLHIKDLGFSVIRVNLVCDSTNPSSYLNTLSDVFFSATRKLGMKVALILNNHNSPEDIKYHLERWGSDLAYIQVLNEPDVASSWDMGALFTDDEATSKFEEFHSIVEQHPLSVLLYTNFGPAFLVRTNLPVKFSEKLDFLGYDVFMDSFLTLSPNIVQLLQKITNKEVVIAEFGMSTSDDEAQCDYILRGLNLFRNMGLRGCWLVYWNSVENEYGIRGRLAEQRVGEWIAQNS